MPSDVTPQLSDDDAQEVNQPTGDLAELARNVGLQQPSQAASTTAGTGTGAKPKKNKDVGKGVSGSSGPPTRKRRNNLVQQPAPVSSDEEDVEVDENAEPGATQHITVGVHRGYSVYPGYLFDVPPKRIRLDHLRKQFIIHEIARARAEHRFYRHSMLFMGVVKEFMRMFATANNMQFPGNSSNGADHAYAMSANDSYEASDDEGSDIEIEGKK